MITLVSIETFIKKGNTFMDPHCQGEMKVTEQYFQAVLFKLLLSGAQERIFFLTVVKC